MDTTIKIRVGTSELAQWRSKAEEEGLTVSAWIRARCTLLSGLNPLESKSVVEQVRETVKFDREVNDKPESPAAKEYMKKHTSASNRLTCGCESCTDYRERNDIPWGGFPRG